jgi:glycosyltransferase involved in cell wall biosynthesis
VHSPRDKLKNILYDNDIKYILMEGSPNVVSPPLLICLSMIVKNESRVICRLLESVYKYIDCYVICDTGSDDGTPEIITKFMNERGVNHGHIIREPFKNFEYSRNYALRAAEHTHFNITGAGTTAATHLLLLDADMIWEPPASTPEQFRRELQATPDVDAYYVFQGSKKFYYKNVRVIRTGKNIHYKSVTHEYICTADGTKYHTFPREEVFINDVGDGGSKTNKFERDIRLLSDDIKENPTNVRSWFYLANSLHDLGRYEESVAAYKRRIELGGWIEEIYYSHYRIGLCNRALGRMADAIMYFMLAFDSFPRRIEPLYEIIRYFREAGKNHLAYMYYVMADKVRRANPRPDFLFVNNEVYLWKLDYEMSIIGYYCNIDKYNLAEICMHVLTQPRGDVENYIIKNVLSNYKFYRPRLAGGGGARTNNLLETLRLATEESRNVLGCARDDMYSSTPSFCICPGGDEIILNVRFVNYRIGEHGEYINRDLIETINVLTVLTWRNAPGGLWEISRAAEIMPYDKIKDNVYVGIEDVRLAAGAQPKKCFYSGNRGLDRGSMMVEIGTIDLSQSAATTCGGFITMAENHKEIEKNWVISSPAETMIYSWAPLTVGEIKPTAAGDSIFIPRAAAAAAAAAAPEIFHHLRGSTNGFLFNGELYFVTHVVSYEDRRFYYHMIVVLEPETYKVLRYTKLFTFEGSPVEYCLGFIILENIVYFGYSIMDRETKYMCMDYKDMEALMCGGGGG